MTSRHGLVGEGQAHDAAGRRKHDADTGGTSGVGYGLCACGTLSPEPLPSGRARRRWHRTHKQEVRR